MKNEETETKRRLTKEEVKLYAKAFGTAALAIGGGLAVGLLMSKAYSRHLDNRYPYSRDPEARVELLREMFEQERLNK